MNLKLFFSRFRHKKLVENNSVSTCSKTIRISLPFIISLKKKKLCLPCSIQDISILMMTIPKIGRSSVDTTEVTQKVSTKDVFFWFCETIPKGKKYINLVKN